MLNSCLNIKSHMLHCQKKALRWNKFLFSSIRNPLVGVVIRCPGWPPYTENACRTIPYNKNSCHTIPYIESMEKMFITHFSYSSQKRIDKSFEWFLQLFEHCWISCWWKKMGIICFEKRAYHTCFYVLGVSFFFRQNTAF